VATIAVDALGPARVHTVAMPSRYSSDGSSTDAAELARRLGAEIVSADSVQVYRGLDIGSAKPSLPERAEIPHHMIDICPPEENMDAGRYALLARQAIAGIHRRGKAAIVVGGSGLYLKALLFGLADIPPVAPGLRESLQRQLEREGLAALYSRLQVLDPLSAAHIKAADKQRILRALEVVLQTGLPLSHYQRRHNPAPAYPCLMWGLTRPREELRELIARRARHMWSRGLADEVAALLARGVNPQAPALASLGYRQAVEFLAGNLSENEALAQMIRLTQAYAKRQMTWFRAMPAIRWISPEQDIGDDSREFLRMFQAAAEA
jgi:tRNA dimethylallyltransferase